MARQLKVHAISGRVNDIEYNTAMAYVEVAQIGMADLVRLAVQEYITNHPVA